MTPRRLRLHGFRTFHDLTLDLPAGCVGVIGDNGAGKSSLVIAIELALFGPQSRSLEPFLTTGEDDLLIELELDHAGERYRIRRNYSAKGRGKSVLDFERDVDFRGGDHPAGCESLTAETAAATQEKIEKTLGLTRETWKASAYLAQGESDTFTSAAPKDRKRILTDALGLHIWDELAALNHTVIVERKQRDTEITARLGVLQEQADRALEAEIATKCATLELQGCDEDLALAAETVLQNEERHAHAQQAATRYETATRAAETAKALLAAHDQLGQAAEEARPLVGAVLTEIVALEPRVKELERLQADRVRLEAEQHFADKARADAEHIAAVTADLRTRITRQQNESGTTRQRMAELEAEHAATCELCGQALGAQARITTIESLAAALETKAATIAALTKQIEDMPAIDVPNVDRAKLDETVARITALANVPTELAAARERLAGHERTIAKTDTDEHRENGARLVAQADQAVTVLANLEAPQPGAADAFLADLQDARNRQTEITAARDRLRVDQARAQQTWEQAQAAQKQVDEHAAERTMLAATLAELAQLEKAYGRDGVPAHIVENTALPTIEAEANRILQVLGGPVTRVELRTERALKSGDGTRDTLDVICLTDDGDRDYSTFSGGERTRVDLALRIALARLLANRRGAESRLLAIDEPDGLDEAGMAALVDVMRELQLAGTFESLILVSHVPALRDAFDTTLTVQRNGNGSEVLVG